MPSPPLAFCRRALAAWAAGSLLTVAAPALAQETTYPSRPVRLLVGFAAGSASDLIARPLAQKLSERLGQPVTVENRPGANGVLASEAVARAAPDGHTLLLGTFSQTVVTPLLRSDLPYDTERDLAPVAGVVQPPLVVAVPADLPARSLGELVALARARPGQLNMGSAGSGDLGHLALELLKRQMGFDIVHVPYRGSGPALQDMLGGRVQLMISPYIVMKGPAEAGQVRVLAVTSSERLPALPDVPTVAEAGGPPGFEAAGFIGLYAPAATPRPVLARVEAGAGWAARETDLPRSYAAQGLLPRPAGAEEFAAYLAREREKWRRVIREAGITAD
jgi:tripartite-type tricarboxylate transporter receptor subunit TctC